MKSNTLTLVAVWIVIIVFWGFLLTGIGQQAWDGDYFAVFPLFLAAGLYVYVRWTVGERRVKVLLQNGSPRPYIAHIRRALIAHSLIPNGDAVLAQAIAIAYLLYGDYANTRATLKTINWNARLPLITASGQSVVALLCYFETHEYEKGLELARGAQQLAQTASALPGAQTSAAAYASYVEIGEILCNRTTPELLESLRHRMEKLPILARLLIAWGLKIGYTKTGNPEQAEVMRTYLKIYAPNCQALTTEIA